MAQKFYVVWIGLNPGVYDSWEACRQQVEGWKGAVYKGFATREEAEEAINQPPENYIEKKAPEHKGGRKKQPKPLPPEVIRQALAVDAACSGNPGQMEYRAVYLGDMEEKFHFRAVGWIGLSTATAVMPSCGSRPENAGPNWSAQPGQKPYLKG